MRGCQSSRDILAAARHIWEKKMDTLLMASLAAACMSGDTAADDIVVTALPAPNLERAYSVTSITGDVLQNSGAVRLDDALRLQPGFQLFRRASSRTANPTTQGVTLRALGGNAASRVTLLLDGVPQDDPFAGWIPFSALTLADVASVRLIRGGGTVASGAGALAGTVSIESATADETGGDIDARYGRYNSYDVSGSVALVQGSFSARISGSVYDSDGYSLIVPGQRGVADIAAASRARTVRATVAYALDTQTSVQLTAALFDEDKLAGFANGPNANDGKDVSLRYVRDDADDDWRIESAVWYKERHFSAKFAAANATRTISTVTLDQFAVPAEGYGGRVELRAPDIKNISVRFGADARWSDGETREFFRSINGQFTRERRAGGKAVTAGAFAEAEMPISDILLLTLGGRVDRWKLSDGVRQETDRTTGAFTLNRVEPDRQGTELTGRAGAVWDISPAVTVRTAAYTGWRLPTLNELYRPFRVGNDVTEANAALRPERLSGVDVGITWQPMTNVTLEATLFWNELRQAIANTTIGAGPGVFPDVGFLPAGGTFRRRDNLPAVRSRGLELQASLPLAQGLTLRSGYAFADATVAKAGGFVALQGKRLTQSARHQASVQIDWADADDRFGASATVRGQSRVFEDDANSRQLDGFVTVDLMARVRLGTGWTARVMLENVTNARIESAISGDGVVTRAQPRSLSLGVQAIF
jgi:vitamin B12 transporter